MYIMLEINSVRLFVLPLVCSRVVDDRGYSGATVKFTFSEMQRSAIFFPALS